MNAAEELTEPDRMIAYALQANGRATWGAIARALGLSERTVQRRGQRLLDSGLVQVSTYLDTTIVGEAHPLVLRLSTRTGAALQVGEELARRQDASSVSVVEGSGDVVCMLLPRTRQDSSRLLLAELPAIDGVVSVEASTVLRYFRSGYDWSVGDLPAPVVETLRAETPTRGATASGPVQLTREDESLVAALAEDGRATVISLAKAADISAPTAHAAPGGTVRRGRAARTDRTLLGGARSAGGSHDLAQRAAGPGGERRRRAGVPPGGAVLRRLHRVLADPRGLPGARPGRSLLVPHRGHRLPRLGHRRPVLGRPGGTTAGPDADGEHEIRVSHICRNKKETIAQIAE